MTAHATASASAEPGTLRAQSSHTIKRPDTNSFANAEGFAIASFTDVVTVGDNGLGDVDPTIDFSLNIHLTGGFGTSGAKTVKGASAEVSVWLFPFIPFTPLDAFSASNNNARFFELERITSSGLGEVSVVSGSLEHLLLGSRFWLHVELKTTAAVRWESFSPDLEASAGANFSNTLKVFFDPLAGNPNAMLVSESGIDYRTPAPVPLPAPVWLLGAAMGALAAARRRTATQTER